MGVFKLYFCVDILNALLLNYKHDGYLSKRGLNQQRAYEYFEKSVFF